MYSRLAGRTWSLHCRHGVKECCALLGDSRALHSVKMFSAADMCIQWLFYTIESIG